MSKVNAEWHKLNKMGENPTPAKRLAWHLEHSKNCRCRVPSKGFLERLKREAGKS